MADTSLISVEYRLEQYAANVGLIKKRKMSLQDTRSTIQTTIPIVERANKGTDVIYTIISYGK
jgi:prefoldin subunit 5